MSRLKILSNDQMPTRLEKIFQIEEVGLEANQILKDVKIQLDLKNIKTLEVQGPSGPQLLVYWPFGPPLGPSGLLWTFGLFGFLIFLDLWILGFYGFFLDFLDFFGFFGFFLDFLDFFGFFLDFLDFFTLKNGFSAKF